MIVLTNPKPFTAMLAAAPAVTQPTIVIAYADVTATSITEATNEITMTGTTPINVVVTPAVGIRRVIKSVAFTNLDTVPATVTLFVNSIAAAKTTVASGSTVDLTTLTGLPVSPGVVATATIMGNNSGVPAVPFALSATATLTVLSTAALTSGRMVFSSAGLLTDAVWLRTETTAVPHGFMVGDGTTNTNVTINGVGVSNSNRDVTWASNTGSTTSGWRWTARVSGAEVGANSGSDWSLIARTDAGATLDTPIFVTRASTGSIFLARPTSITGTLTVSTLTSGRVPYASTAGLLVDNANLQFAPSGFASGFGSAGAALQVQSTGANVACILTGPATQNRTLAFHTAGSARWAWYAQAQAETGANAGTGITLEARDDAGAVIDNPITIIRAAGSLLTLSRPTTISYTSAQLTTGNGAGAPRILIDGAAANNRLLNFRTAGSTRWQMGADATAEGGADAGSLFVISAYTDAAALIDNPISIVRAASGNINLSRQILVTATTASAIVNNTVGGAVALALRNNTAAALDSGPLLAFQGDTGSSTSGIIAALWNAAANTDSYLAFSVRRAGAITQIGRFTSTGNLLLGTSTDIAGNGGISVANTTSAASSITGALLVGNGVAATNVGIGGGNINAGGTGTFGGNVTVTTTGGTAVLVDTTAAGAANPAFVLRSGGTRYWDVAITGGTGDKSLFIYDNVGAYSVLNITRAAASASVARFLGTLDATSVSSASVAMSGGLGVTKTLVTGAARILKTRSVVSAAATTALDGTDHACFLTGATTQTFTLPAAANGRQLIIKNRSTGALTVNRAGADTIDGLTTLNVAAGAGIILIANGTDWCVI